MPLRYGKPQEVQIEEVRAIEDVADEGEEGEGECEMCTLVVAHMSRFLFAQRMVEKRKYLPRRNFIFHLPQNTMIVKHRKSLKYYDLNIE